MKNFYYNLHAHLRGIYKFMGGRVSLQVAESFFHKSTPPPEQY
ncbi:hypothetical protein [Anditalea andensis]|nr:hypothetical protein [Anditalea andensis]